MADATPAGRGTMAASVIGALGSAGTSLLATLCCVGPLAYTVLGAGGVLAAARLQPWRPWILGASAVFLAFGFWSAYRRHTAVVDGQVCRVKASCTIRATLWVAAVLTVAVAVLPPVLS
jgi:mercuric ion transport protein